MREIWEGIAPTRIYTPKEAWENEDILAQSRNSGMINAGSVHLNISAHAETTKQVV